MWNDFLSAVLSIRSADTPVTGTVTDSDYNRSTVTGTVTETVPVVVSYAYTTLAIEAKAPDGTWKELRSFGRQGHCHMSYGNCIADGDQVRPLCIRGMLVRILVYHL